MSEITEIVNREVICTGDSELDLYFISQQEKFIKIIEAMSEQFTEAYTNSDLNYFMFNPKLANTIKEGWKLSSNFLIDKLGFDALLYYFKTFKVDIMENEEFEYLNGLDDCVTIYRGESLDRNLSYPAISWTLDIEVAEIYAATRGGKILKGVVAKSDIYSIFFEEYEVLVRPGSVTIIDS